MISAFAPNYLCLLLFRGLVGIGIGGGFLALVLCNIATIVERMIAVERVN